MEQPQKKRAVLRARGTKQLVAWLFSGGLLVAALGLIGYRVLHPPRVVGPVCALPNPPPDPARDKAGALFQEAKTLIRQDKWTDARAKLLEVRSIAPDYPSVEEYLAHVEKELPNQGHLDEAQQALTQKKLAVARTELNLVSADTTMFEQVSQLRRALREATDAKVREAREQLAAGQLSQAQGLIEDVLATDPEHQEARELSGRLKRMRDGDPVVPPIIDFARPPWDQARYRFLDGDLSGAVALTQACLTRPECKNLLKDLKQFQTLYDSPTQLTAAQLAKLLDLEKRLAGPEHPSKLFASASPPLEEALYESAQAAQAKGKGGKAIELAQYVLMADPDNAGARRIISEVRLKAKELYLQAYAIKDARPKEGIAGFRQVMDLTLPDEELHLKAKTWLEKLQK